MGFTLNKQEFCGCLFENGWPILNTPSYCSCGQKNSVDHRLNCKLSSYVEIRHIIRDFEVCWHAEGKTWTAATRNTGNKLSSIGGESMSWCIGPPPPVATSTKLDIFRHFSTFLDISRHLDASHISRLCRSHWWEPAQNGSYQPKTPQTPPTSPKHLQNTSTQLQTPPPSPKHLLTPPLEKISEIFKTLHFSTLLDFSRQTIRNFQNSTLRHFSCVCDASIYVEKCREKSSNVEKCRVLKIYDGLSRKVE